ncbi:MAG: hypothetical protein ACRBN8_20120 [Nannocystales bacterium]
MKSYLTALLILSTPVTLGCNPSIDLGDLPGETEGGSGSAGDTAQTDGTSTAESAGTTTDSDTDAQPEGDVEGLDVLFVLDNSGSMEAAQRRLQESAASIVAALDATGLDYRIGSTTTDNGNYWCVGSATGDPDNGHLVPPASCRSRSEDFYFVGTDTDAYNEACADLCGLDELSLAPGAPPWLSSNTLAGTSMVDALTCSLPMGINGCGFEQPLEAMHLAMALSETPGSAENGFIRPNAHLVVIFVTDEVDCSLNPTHEQTVVGEESVGNQVFWSLPDVQISPTSAVCWNAGVQCSGPGTPQYDACVAHDKAVDGSDATSEADSVIRPLARYAKSLASIRASKVAGAGVYTYGITGVPDFYEGPEDVVYADGPDASNPNSFQATFGIGSGCLGGGIEAVPPVRMLEFTQDGDQVGTSLFSVCSSTYTDFFGQMFAQVGG